MFGSGLGQGVPIVPIAQGILQLLEFGDKLTGFRRSGREFRGIARPLDRETVAVQQFIVHRIGCYRYLRENFSGDRQWIPASFQFQRRGGSLQPLSNLPKSRLLQQLAELCLLLRSKFQQSLHQLGLAPWLDRNLQTAQGCQLDVQIADPASASADSSQHLQKLLLITIARSYESGQQRFQTPARRAEAMDSFRLPVRGEPEYLALHLAEETP